MRSPTTRTVREDNAKNGTGAASGVAWNSNVWDIPGERRRPPYIGLAHELIHAWHNAYGIKCRWRPESAYKRRRAKYWHRICRNSTRAKGLDG
jgi:Effector protein